MRRSCVFYIYIYIYIYINRGSNPGWGDIFIKLHYSSTFRSMFAVARMAFFSTVLMLCSPGLFLRYFLNDFQMGPVAPIITGITWLFGRAVAQWLRHYATYRQVAGLIPDGVIGIFQWHNPSGRTMALGSTQPLTEMSTRCISWG
jgi:hypothetical protein